MSSSPNSNDISKNITLSDEEILAFTIYAFINQGFQSLSKLINSNSTQIIDGSILDYYLVSNGLYSKHLGGPIWIAERQIKLSQLYKDLKEISDKYPDKLQLKPSELLESVVESSASLTEELYFRKKSFNSKNIT